MTLRQLTTETFLYKSNKKKFGRVRQSWQDDKWIIVGKVLLFYLMNFFYLLQQLPSSVGCRCGYCYTSSVELLFKLLIDLSKFHLFSKSCLLKLTNRSLKNLEFGQVVFLVILSYFLQFSCFFFVFLFFNFRTKMPYLYNLEN